MEINLGGDRMPNCPIFTLSYFVSRSPIFPIYSGEKKTHKIPISFWILNPISFFCSKLRLLRSGSLFSGMKCQITNSQTNSFLVLSTASWKWRTLFLLKQPETGLSPKSCLNLSRIWRSKFLNIFIYHSVEKKNYWKIKNVYSHIFCIRLVALAWMWQP